MKINSLILLFYFFSVVYGQILYNHPELKWNSFETEHFIIHFHDGTENSAREAATIAEYIYKRYR